MGIGRVAFGTDANGFSPLPAPRPGSRVSMPWSTQARPWNYNVDGVANYGMIAEFMQDLRLIDASPPPDGPAPVVSLLGAAESFARTWERAELASRVALSPEVSAGPDVRIFTPAPTAWLCPTKLVAGDREFDGHGPEVWASVRLERRADQVLEAVVDFRARETQHDWSETEGSWRFAVSPPGMRVTEILSDTRSATHAISSAAGFQIIGPGGNPNSVSTPPVTGAIWSRGSRSSAIPGATTSAKTTTATMTPAYASCSIRSGCVLHGDGQRSEAIGAKIQWRDKHSLLHLEVQR